MARSDLVVSLAQAGVSGDQARARQVVEAVMAEERAKQHHLVADQLSHVLRSAREVASSGAPAEVGPGVLQVSPVRRLSEVFLPGALREEVKLLVREHHQRRLLATHGMVPRHTVLMSGPPGTGKTLLAEAIAAELDVPMYVARYETLISSYLGETAQRIDEVCAFVRSQKRCVLFLDEFDTVAKERSDRHESGEIKRVVSTLLLQLDRLPESVVTIAATNHPEMLDVAVDRRFQLHIPLDLPDQADVKQFVERLCRTWNIDTRHDAISLARQLDGLSFAEIEDVLMDIHRRVILAGDDETMDPHVITQQRLALIPND